MESYRQEDLRRRRPVALEGPGRRRSQLVSENLIEPPALRHAVINGTLRRVAWGLYVPAGQAGGRLTDHVSRLQALTNGTGLVATHATAAALQGLLGIPLEPPFHLTAPRDGSRPRRPGLVTAHRMNIPPQFITEAADIPVTTPARTWADLAATKPLVEAVVDADILLREPRLRFEGPGRAVITCRKELLAAVASKGKAPGIGVAKRAAALARRGSDSPQETRLRLALHFAGLPEPEVNTWISDAAGRPLFEPDLSYRRYRVAVQYEGRHHSSPDQVERDVRRSELAEDNGWVEVRITNRHSSRNWAPAVEKVAKALRARGWT